jgi:hypothetical protein
VLKPRRASGSWHTVPVGGVDELCDLWDYLATQAPEVLLLEEYMPDGPPMPEGFEADYVSVETIVEAGRMTHLAITGRFPWCWQNRGMAKSLDAEIRRVLNGFVRLPVDACELDRHADLI